jgi:hypothetical protein
MNSGVSCSSHLAEIEDFLKAAPIYYQPWWLEAVAPRAWDYVVVRRGPTIAAVMPVVKQRCRLLQKRLGMPPLTHTLGPWLRPSKAKYCKMLTEQKKLLTELIEALPEHDYFRQDFHFSTTNWLPFYWKGFSETTRYTCVLQNLEDLDAVWKGFDPELRSKILQAQEHLKVADDLGIDAFLQTCEEVSLRQGNRYPYPRDLILRIHEACKVRNAGRMFFAIGSDNRIHSAIYVAWTPYAVCYILGGGKPDLIQTSDANCLLLWEAIRFAPTVAQRFDFEGSMVRPMVHFFRQFGARQMPHSRITRANGIVCKACEMLRLKVRPSLMASFQR